MEKESLHGMSTLKTLPHWDLSVVYPGLTSPEFDQGFAHFAQQVADLVRLFDTNGIEAGQAQELTAATIATFETITARFNAVLEEAGTLGAYLGCLVTTDTRDTLAQARYSEFQQQAVKLSLLSTRYAAWIGSLDVETLIARSTMASEHAFMLRKASIQARHLMSPAEEDLAAELELSSGVAWEKLHNDVTSQILVPLEIRGERRELPMSMVRNFADDPDRAVRRAAYEAELAGWKQAAVPLAAALNGIKGQVNTLARRRGWNSPLDASLFDSNIDRETLEAMLTAARESFPDFRRYLRAKARVLGLEKLAWYDLCAPVGKEKRTWDYEEARAFIIEKFGSYSQRLSDFAARAFRENWIDAEPRAGKIDGAYCTPLRKDESRVFANFKPSFNGVSTLAHELGHGYHNLNLCGRTDMQKNTPMTLAETASIFCETIIVHAALAKADREEQIAILENSLQGACQVVVDITSRFLFESRVFAQRKQRELSIDEFNTLMLEAQKETYGDGLDETQLHPYMWAMKPHYYSAHFSFYNYPYMFGLLFGLGLYARYQQDPAAFRAGYDELLSSTGLDDAAALAARFGIDIRSTDFWRSSLAIVRKDIDLFEKLSRQE
jgi:oligoendopeptidase F